ncbi:TPA: hypothetical protein MGL38_12670 [Klebsiella pneumoniae]|nr:hypothetical protein [Klebsiella pneumoniae]
MTKSTITRKRLAKIKSWRETYGAGSNVMLPAEEAEELARNGAGSNGHRACSTIQHSEESCQNFEPALASISF